MNRWQGIRMGLVMAVAIGAFAGLAARLVHLHLGPNEETLARLRKQRTFERRLLGNRGRIHDRNGEILALDLEVKNVCADPKFISENANPRAVGVRLAYLLQMDLAVVMTQLDRTSREFIFIQKNVSEPVAETIERMKLKGVMLDGDMKRHYPKGKMMSHVVGFANHEGMGSAGIEQATDSYLRAQAGLRVGEKDGRSHEVYNRRRLEMKPQDGANIYLCLDQHLQYMVEMALDEAMRTHSAKGAWAIVQRPRTGEILAMASKPDYDLNQFSTTSEEVRRNRTIAFNYEPGSTMKPLVIAAALNEGLADPDEMIDCEGGYWIYNRRPLKDYHGYGMLSLWDVLKKSSNIGTAKVALRMSESKMEDYLRNFGFGRQLGLGLPGEEAGIVHPYRRWTSLSQSRMAMGHEISVTSLQMVNAVSAIANDGFVMKPRIIDRITDAAGQELVKTEPEVISRPIRKDTADLMKRMMARITEEDGTGRRAALDTPGYPVAGKTGTAQKPVHGGYSDTANVASFVGFLPVERPELSIIVVVDEPQPLHTGGAVAAPVFKEIAEQAVRYLNIPATDDLETASLQ